MISEGFNLVLKLNARTAKMIVVVSDIHFGARESSLNNKTNIHFLIEELEFTLRPCRNQIKELVLLGDILDFHLSKYSTAINKAKNFFSILNKIQSCKNRLRNGPRNKSNRKRKSLA